MTVSDFFAKCVTPVARRLGLEIVRQRTPQRDLTLPAALARLRRHGFPVASVIDVGASNGRWSRKVLNYFPEAQFLLVDPLEERRVELERFKAEYANVDFALTAAGDREGEISFYVSSDLDGSGVAEGAGTLRSVPLTTLDLLVARRKLAGPFLLKLDTHGFEVPIFEGAKEILRQTSVLIIEAYNFQLTSNSLRFHEMCAYLENLGFRCYDMIDPYVRPGDGALWQMDLVFAPKDAAVFQRSTYQ